MGSARPQSRYGSRTRQTPSAGRLSPPSSAHRHNDDLPYSNTVPIVWSPSTSTHDEDFRALRYPQDHGNPYENPDGAQYWLLKNTDPQLLEGRLTCENTESEKDHAIHQVRDQLLSNYRATNGVDTSNNVGSRSNSELVNSRTMVRANSERSEQQKRQTLQNHYPLSVPWPSDVVRALHNLRKHRTRLSFHGQTFREHHEYVKDERNQLANVVAMLLQEVQKAPGLVLSSSRIQTLSEDIAGRHTRLAQTEAQLDATKDLIVQTERSLQSVEEELCTYIIPDVASNDADVVGDIFGSILSESFSSAKSTSSIDDPEAEVDNPPIEHALQPQVALLNTDIVSAKTSADLIVVEQPTLITDEKRSRVEIRAQPYWAADLTAVAAIRHQQNFNPELQWLGEHYWEQSDIHDHLPDDTALTNILAASSSHIVKRQRDLKETLCQASEAFNDSKVFKVTSGSSTTSSNRNHILHELLHVTRSSWLELSRFALYFNEFARGALWLHDLRFEDIDRKLQEVSLSEDVQVSKTPLLAVSTVSTVSSLASIKINIWNGLETPHSGSFIEKNKKASLELPMCSANLDLPAMTPQSVHPGDRAVSLTALPRSEPRARLAQPSSLPGDLPKYNFAIARFSTL